ncbi:MAG: tetratricopeptide repeat protein, partial [Anaerolinea sp.]|nr:tetratricopeptide repeat protein [Anaerolinea sp.]
GDSAKALDYLDQCVATDPENVACLNYLATVQLALLETDDAMQTYRQLMNTQPTDSIYYLRAGRTFANANQCTVAVPWLEQGYALEQERGDQSLDRLAAFEEFLLGCGAAITPVYSSPEDTTTESAN